MVADGFDEALLAQCAARVSYAAISRARLPKMKPSSRGGLALSVGLSHDTSFNREFRVTFTTKELAAGNCDKNLEPPPPPGGRSARPPLFDLGDRALCYSTNISSFGAE